MPLFLPRLFLFNIDIDSQLIPPIYIGGYMSLHFVTFGVKLAFSVNHSTSILTRLSPTKATFFLKNFCHRLSFILSLAVALMFIRVSKVALFDNRLNPFISKLCQASIFSDKVCRHTAIGFDTVLSLL